MAPGYRTATTTRRGNRSGYPEHDDFEGLPVRQWRQQLVNIAPPPVSASTKKQDRWDVELPWGMPKDYHLLPPHSQELLRAARSGQLYKRKAPQDEDDVPEAADIPTGTGTGTAAGIKLSASVGPGGDAGAVADEKSGEKKAAPTSKTETGIWVKKWVRLPREAEDPLPSRLAKRHKNTILLPSKATAQFSGPTLTRVKLRRLDAAGNAYEQTVTVNDDEQLNQLDGEIISTTVIAAPTVAETTAQQQATPTRKRPPPPPHKKKHKGPGRGRKKKLGALPLPLPQKPNAPSNPTDGAADPNAQATTGPDGIKQEEHGTETPDVEMAENSAVASDEEDGDDDEGEEGEEVEGNEDGNGDDGQGDDVGGDTTEQENQDDQDHEMEDVDASMDAIRPSSIEEPVEGLEEGETEVIDRAHSHPTNPMTLGPLPGMSHLVSPRQHEGSPLKNVILQSPTEPKNMAFPNISASEDIPRSASDAGSSHEAMEMAAESSQSGVSVTAIQSTTVDGMTTTVVSEVAMTDEIAADSGNEADVPPADSQEAEKALPPIPDNLPEGDKATGPVKKLEEPVPAARPYANPVSFTQQTTSTHSLLPSLREPRNVPNSPPPATTRGEEGVLDLLGGLERELDRQSRTSSTGPAAAEEI